MTKTQKRELDNIVSQLRQLTTEMQGKYDDMSEEQQESEKGELLQEEIGRLEDIADDLDTIGLVP